MEIKEALLRYLKRQGYSQISLKAVLFDMDGVLYNSMPLHAYAWEKAISEMGIPCRREEFYQYEGQTGRQTITHLFERAFGRPSTDEENQQVYALKSRYFSEQGPSELMKGASAVLKQTLEAHLIPVLVTGSGQASLLDKLEHHYPGCFTRERMVTAFDVHHGKPHPEPYLRGLQKVKAQPNEAFVVENAPLGVKAAVAAGIFTIAVNTGPIPDTQLYEAGADIVLTGMEELAQRFPELLSAIQQTHD